MGRKMVIGVMVFACLLVVALGVGGQDRALVESRRRMPALSATDIEKAVRAALKPDSTIFQEEESRNKLIARVMEFSGTITKIEFGGRRAKPLVSIHIEYRSEETTTRENDEVPVFFLHAEYRAGAGEAAGKVVGQKITLRADIRGVGVSEWVPYEERKKPNYPLRVFVRLRPLPSPKQE